MSELFVNVVFGVQRRTPLFCLVIQAAGHERRASKVMRQRCALKRGSSFAISVSRVAWGHSVGASLQLMRLGPGRQHGRCLPLAHAGHIQSRLSEAWRSLVRPVGRVQSSRWWVRACGDLLKVGDSGFVSLVGGSTSQQHAGVSQGRICEDICACCLNLKEVADQTFYLTQLQYTLIRDSGPVYWPSTRPP